jgi:hypothetical protein
MPPPFVAHHDERLLAALGMDWQRPVGEPESIRLVHDGHDATRRLDEPDRKRRAHRDVRADPERAVGHDAEAGWRGTSCKCDFSAIDHLARAGEPIDAVRAECGITPRAH